MLEQGSLQPGLPENHQIHRRTLLLTMFAACVGGAEVVRSLQGSSEGTTIMQEVQQLMAQNSYVEEGLPVSGEQQAVGETQLLAAFMEVMLRKLYDIEAQSQLFPVSPQEWRRQFSEGMLKALSGMNTFSPGFWEAPVPPPPPPPAPPGLPLQNA